MGLAQSAPGSPGEGRKSDVHKEWLDHTREHWPALYEVIEAAYSAHSPSMAAFLAFMSVRLIEMHRILKPTGSLYLHCDSTANSYLRLMLDSIFGVDNFRNEVVWSYRKMPNRAKHFQKNHDVILFYSKSNEYTFNRQYEAYSESSQRTYARAAKVGYNVNVKKKMATVWDWDKYNDAVARGDIPSGLSAVPFKGKGSPMRAVWDIPILSPSSKERTGWTTQKPLALYRRIIEASSNEGDVVLDPFCGCATTCVAAEQLGRQWVGIDQSPKAKGIVKDRLKSEVQRAMAWDKTVTVANYPPQNRSSRTFVSHSVAAAPFRNPKARRQRRADKRAELRPQRNESESSPERRYAVPRMRVRAAHPARLAEPRTGILGHRPHQAKSGQGKRRHEESLSALPAVQPPQGAYMDARAAAGIQPAAQENGQRPETQQETGGMKATARRRRGEITDWSFWTIDASGFSFIWRRIRERTKRPRCFVRIGICGICGIIGFSGFYRRILDRKRLSVFGF